MGTFKKKEYEGKEIIVDETDKNIKSIHFLMNGTLVLIDADIWDAVKKEFVEAFA